MKFEIFKYESWKHIAGAVFRPMDKNPDTAKIYHKSNGSNLYSLLAPMAFFIRTHLRSTNWNPNNADI